MTSFGRGRGWATQSQDRDQSLRRPGGNSFGTNKVLKEIVDKLVSYDERESMSPQLIQEIVDLLTVAINEDSLRYRELQSLSLMIVVSACPNVTS